MTFASTIPGAIDYLITQVRLLPEFADPVVVADGWSSATAGDAIVIGITPDDPDTGSTRAHAEIGAGAKTEEYDIPCILWAWRGGGDEVMKPARDAAFAMFNAVVVLLQDRTHWTLGGLLNSGIAAILDMSMIQTSGAAEAGEGRACLIEFSIHCKSRLSA